MEVVEDITTGNGDEKHIKEQDDDKQQQQQQQQQQLNNSHTIRVYLSYSSPDMDEERNYVMRNVYPELKKTCSSFGLQFDLVDMKYNYNGDLGNNHDLEELAAREIKSCQTLSNRPNFVALIGDKYSNSTLPSKIPEEVFETFLKKLLEENDDVRILNRWFQKDENCEPAMYVLQPVQTVLEEYDGKTRETKWVTSRKQLQNLLSKAANILASQEGELPMQSYLRSAIDKEAQNGIISSSNPSKECACFVRNFHIDDISMATNDEPLNRHFDLAENGMICLKRKEYLEELCFEKLQTLVTKMNFDSFKVNWLQDGIDPKYSVHKYYLKSFAESFRAIMLNLIHDYVDILQNQQITKETLLSNEIQNNTTFCEKACESFLGRTDLLEKLQKNLSGCFSAQPDKKPLLLHGISGSGKTYLMAMLIKKAKEWTGKTDLVIIHRFLGTSDKSQDILNVLASICQQIIQEYGFEELLENYIYDDFNRIKIHFQELLSKIESENRCLLLVIDSLDQLLSFNNKYLVNWLPRQLHKNLMVVLSTESNKHNILRNFKFLFGSNCKNTSSPTISIDGIQETPRSDRTSISDVNLPDTDENGMLNSSFNGSSANKTIEKKRSRRKSSKVSPRMPTVTENEIKQTRSSSLKGNKIVPDIMVQRPTPRNGPEAIPSPTPEVISETTIEDSALEHDSTFTREATYEQVLLQGREASSVSNIHINKSYCAEDSSNLLKVDDTLNYEDRNAILKYWFTRANRTATQFQSDYVKSCIEICSQPLYVKLVVDEALTWSSFDHISTLALPLTASEMIALIFQRLEEKHGTTLVSHSLAYLTTAKQGLSECELLDILSLDNMILNDVFEEFDPPVNDVIRLPTFLWKQIRYSLDKYIVEQNVNGICVLKWSHRLFWEVSTQRYLKNEEKVKYINKILSEFFLGSYSNTIKQITLQKRDGKHMNAQRHVVCQPLEYQREYYNIRKLIELPSVLIRCKNEKVLFNQVFFNFNWIKAKINALSLGEVIYDMKEYLRDECHKDVQLLQDTLILCLHDINRDKSAIANQLLGRLSNIDCREKPYLSRLLDGIKEQLSSYNQPVLSLQNKCLSSAKDDLKILFMDIGEVKFLQCIAINNDEVFICVSTNKKKIYINFYSVNDGDVISSIILNTEYKSFPTILMSETKNTLYVGHSRLEIIDVNSMTRKATLENDKVQITCVAGGVDESVICVAYSNGLLRLYDVANSSVLADIGIGGSTIVHAMFLNDKQTVLVGPYLKSSWALVNYNSLKVSKLDPSITRSVKSTSCVLKMVAQDAIVTSNDNDIHAWNFQTQKFLYTFRGHSSDIYCLVQLNEDMFASAGADCVVKLWYLSKHILLNTLRSHGESIVCMFYCKSINTLASGSKDRTVKVWNLDEFKCKDTYIEHSSSVTHLAISASTIISASKNRMINVWQMRNGIEKSALEMVHNKPCSVVNFSSDFKSVLTLSECESVILWDVQSKTAVWEYKGNATSVCCSGDKPVFYVGTEQGELVAFKMLRDLTKQLFSHPIDNGKISFISFVASDTLIICTHRGAVYSFHSTYKKEELLYTHNGAVTCVDVNDDVIVAGSNDCKVSIHIRDAESKVSYKLLLEGSKKPITCAAILKSRGAIVACNSVGTLHSWSLDTGDVLFNFSCSSKVIHCIVGNKQTVITGGKEVSAPLMEWNYTTGNVLTQFTGHNFSVSCLKLTGDMKFLLSAALDGRFIVWDLNNKTQIDTINFNSPITSFTVSKLIENMVYKIVAVMKSGRVAFVDFQVTSQNEKNRTSANRGHLIMLHDVNVANATDRKQSTAESGNDEDQRCCVIL